MTGRDPAYAADDGALISQALDGRMEAVEILYRRLFGPLVRYCRRISSEDPEDLAQEAWTRALSSLDSFETSRPLWPWLKTIASHAATDTARKRRREVVMDTGALEVGVASQAGVIEDRSVLAAALSGLTPGQRIAVGLRDVEDWEMSQAADFLGLSQPAFRRLLFRARRRLRTEYDRLSQGALGIFVPLLGRLRRIGRETTARMQRTGIRSAHYEGLAGEGICQLVVGVVALSLLGGTSVRSGAPSPGSRERLPIIVSADLGDAEPGKDSRTSNDIGRSAHEEGEGRTRPGSKQTGEAARDLGKWVADPAEETQQPEDSRILSIQPSPRFDRDRTAFAVGTSSCEEITCSSVLFETRDGGATWTRLPAEGLDAESLLLPPSFGVGDDRIFAMGHNGIQASHDRGASFSSASAAMGPHVSGPAAMSPAFSSGDPTILIGGSIVLRYRDGQILPEPLPGPTSSSPIEPAYSPDYAQDGIVLLGGTQVDATLGRWVATLDRCVAGSCLPVSFQGQDASPKPRFSPDFVEDTQVLAFTDRGLFLSHDSGESFQEVAIPASGEFLTDIQFLSGGTIVASTLPGPSGHAGLYLSMNGGESWVMPENPILAQGARSIAVAGDRIFAALATNGVVCSTDRGATWTPRC